MSFLKYPKNYHANGYGWHNMAAMGYAKPPSPSSGSISSGVSSIYPSPYSGMPMPMPTPGAFASSGPAMPTLPNSQYNNGGNVGVQLSYGFAPGIVPAQIPNVPRADSINSGPKLGWNIGGVGAGGSSAPSITSVDSGVHDPIKAQQETVCQSIFVPEEDRPIYSFGFPSVSEYDESSSNDAVKPIFWEKKSSHLVLRLSTFALDFLVSSMFRCPQFRHDIRRKRLASKARRWPVFLFSKW